MAAECVGNSRKLLVFWFNFLSDHLPVICTHFVSPQHNLKRAHYPLTHKSFLSDLVLLKRVQVNLTKITCVEFEFTMADSLKQTCSGKERKKLRQFGLRNFAP